MANDSQEQEPLERRQLQLLLGRLVELLQVLQVHRVCLVQVVVWTKARHEEQVEFQGCRV